MYNKVNWRTLKIDHQNVFISFSKIQLQWLNSYLSKLGYLYKLQNNIFRENKPFGCGNLGYGWKWTLRYYLLMSQKNYYLLTLSLDIYCVKSWESTAWLKSWKICLWNACTISMACSLSICESHCFVWSCVTEEEVGFLCYWPWG